jgi:hypothetical protein
MKVLRSFKWLGVGNGRDLYRSLYILFSRRLPMSIMEIVKAISQIAHGNIQNITKHESSPVYEPLLSSLQSFIITLHGS